MLAPAPTKRIVKSFAPVIPIPPSIVKATTDGWLNLARARCWHLDESPDERFTLAEIEFLISCDLSRARLAYVLDELGHRRYTYLSLFGTPEIVMRDLKSNTVTLASKPSRYDQICAVAFP